MAVIKELMDKHGNVVFGGDGYSSEWHKLAVEERGLKNIPTTADALPAFKDKEIIKLFEETGVLSPVELESRFGVYAEQYVMAITVEAKLVISMAKTIIYPVATRYLTDLSIGNADLSAAGIQLDKGPAEKIAAAINGMTSAVGKLEEAIEKDDFASEEEHMQFCANDLLSLMNEVRAHADTLETEVADDMWPLPTYQEMLFIK
jgi:glutamine synthetase